MDEERGTLRGLWFVAVDEISAAWRSAAGRIQSRWRDLAEDRRLGIGTEAWETAAPVPAGRHGDSYGYSPTPYEHLKMLAAFLPLSRSDVFVDVGCGRGRVACFMADKGARKVVGVELVEELADRARANAAAAASRGGAPVEILRGDAAALPPALVDEGTVFYLFSPFGLRTLRDFVDGLEESLRRRPRELVVVYRAPTHRWTLDDRAWLTEDSRFSRSLDVMIWRSRPASP